MNEAERKLVKKQLTETELFKENTVTYWNRDIATNIISKLDSILANNPKGNGLTVAEDDVQDLCDIFEGKRKAVYQNKSNYELCCTKYDDGSEPFNHLRKVHQIVDLIKQSVTNH